MKNRQYFVRPLNKQFSPEIYSEIISCIDRIDSFRRDLQDGVLRFHIVELVSCLKAGNLFAGLLVSSVILELFLQSLIVEYSNKAKPKPFLDISYKEMLEENKGIGFKKMLDELCNVGLFDKKDAEDSKEFYDNIRIPIMHGLGHRFISKNSDESVLLTSLGINFVGFHEFEKIIEDFSLIGVSFVIGVIERNLPK